MKIENPITIYLVYENGVLLPNKVKLLIYLRQKWGWTTKRVRIPDIPTTDFYAVKNEGFLSSFFEVIKKENVPRDDIQSEIRETFQKANGDEEMIITFEQYLGGGNSVKFTHTAVIDVGESIGVETKDEFGNVVEFRVLLYVVSSQLVSSQLSNNSSKGEMDVKVQFL